MSAEFRALSMSNDTRFQELRSMLLEKTESPKHEAIECLEVSDADVDMLDFEFLEERDSLHESVCSEPCKEADSIAETSTPRTKTKTTTIEQTTKQDYSANYIEPGETLVSDEEDIHPKDLIYTALNPTYPRVVPHIRVRGKRKLHLCNICATLV
uniref:Uncharacterized protein n=1 Tax=Anopheles culicifacies TaxID=139723 RepID=A0A182MR84_9DIPT